MTKPGVTEKEYNPTVTAFFDAPEWGRDATEDTPESLVVSVTTRSGKTFNKELGSAFISMPIDEKAFAVIKEHATVGRKMLLRRSKNLNKKGGYTYFLELMKESPKANNTESDI